MKETQSPIVPRLKPKLPALWKRCTKEELMQLIDEKFGVITSLCNELDCTYTQFYSAVKHWGLQEHLTKAKDNLVALAEHSLVQCLKSEDEKVRLQAAQTVLRMRGSRQGWSSAPQVAVQTQVNIADKETKIKEIFNIE